MRSVYSLSSFTIVKFSLTMGPLLSRSYYSLSLKGFSTMNKNNPIQLIFNQLHELNQLIASGSSNSISTGTSKYFDNEKILNIFNYPNQNTQLQNCLNLMKNVSLEDIGYHNINMNSIRDSHCVTVYSCQSFDIAAFIIPTG